MTQTINSKIMTWAREESHYTVEEAAEKLAKSVEVIQKWESEGVALTLSELKKVANVYKRQMAAFFLDDVPDKTKIPQERRNMRTTEDNIHPETMLAIRRTSRYLKIAKELNSEDSITQQYQWLEELRGGIDNTELIAEKLRLTIGIDVNEQRKFHTPENALRKWREAFETKLGIYTFSLLMPYQEIDGFSYIEDGIPYAISVNSRNSKNRNIFTLFHELAHIIEGSSGLCLTNKGNNASDPERRCDNFAAIFLLPKTEMVVPPGYRELSENAKNMSVSMEAYVRRLQQLEMISFQRMTSLIEQIPVIRSKPKKEMKIPPVVMSKSRRGEKFFNLVLDAYSDGKLSSSAAADILAVKTSRIDSL